MKSKIQPPVALVTGASRGLGRGIAVELAKAGMSVGIHYAGNEVAAHETAACCANVAPHGEIQRFEPVQADIGNSTERNALFSATMAMFGRLDALINNVPPRLRSPMSPPRISKFLPIPQPASPLYFNPI